MDTLNQRIATSHLKPLFVVTTRRTGTKATVELWIDGKFHRRPVAAEGVRYTVTRYTR